MGRFSRRRRWAYYSRNQSYSKSANAEAAESDGRYPRTRAAAALGVNVKAFDAGCTAAGYHSTEWHHVGKYATQLDYYDTNELRANPGFWHGAAGAYVSKKKQSELMGRAAILADENRQDRRASFTARLIRQRDCTVPVVQHGTAQNWEKFVLNQLRKVAGGISNWRCEAILPGDFARLRAEISNLSAAAQTSNLQPA